MISDQLRVFFKQDFFSQNEIYFYHTLKNQLSELINQHELIIESQNFLSIKMYMILYLQIILSIVKFKSE